MNYLQVTDLGGGQVQVAWHREGEVPRHCPEPVSFADPRGPRERGELRWYLEEYLRFPYGAERERAARVEQEMQQWGESLFAQLFTKAAFDPDPRALYQEAVREGLDQCELCISSEDPEFLNIPWELIRDPTPGRGYLAPLMGGLFRQRSGQKIDAPLRLSPEESFRILLVIARPYGERDVAFGTVARPMLEALRPLRPRVQLDLLRPPTFDALVDQLNTQRGHYHLVHFDGHGVFAPAGLVGGRLAQFGQGGGHLVFEKTDGSERVVSSHDLGQALATCRVPLFVLNVCQSAGRVGLSCPSRPCRARRGGCGPTRP